MSADELESARAALRAAGGQEKPNDRLPSIACSCRFHGPNGDHWDCGRDCGCNGPQAGWQWRTVLRAALAAPAAPVGGQAEPSDAMVKRAAELLIAHYSLLLRDPIPDDSPQWATDAARILQAAAAVSATPPRCPLSHGTGRCTHELRDGKWLSRFTEGDRA